MKVKSGERVLHVDVSAVPKFRQHDFEQREALRRAAREAARSVFLARRERFAADGRD